MDDDDELNARMCEQEFELERLRSVVRGMQKTLEEVNAKIMRTADAIEKMNPKPQEHHRPDLKILKKPLDMRNIKDDRDDD